METVGYDSMGGTIIVLALLAEKYICGLRYIHGIEVKCGSVHLIINTIILTTLLCT